jgi:hypothetical protein
MLSLLLALATPSPAHSSCNHGVELQDPFVITSTTSSSPSPYFAVVKVLVAPNGSIEQAHMYKSSGKAFIDNVALGEALRLRYVAKVVNCKAVEGSYFFVYWDYSYPRPKFTPPP